LFEVNPKPDRHFPNWNRLNIIGAATLMDQVPAFAKRTSLLVPFLFKMKDDLTFSIFRFQVSVAQGAKGMVQKAGRHWFSGVELIVVMMLYI
jgi:hypothetical protein